MQHGVRLTECLPRDVHRFYSCSVVQEALLEAQATNDFVVLLAVYLQSQRRCINESKQQRVAYETVRLTSQRDHTRSLGTYLGAEF